MVYTIFSCGSERDADRCVSGDGAGAGKPGEQREPGGAGRAASQCRRKWRQPTEPVRRYYSNRECCKRRSEQTGDDALQTGQSESCSETAESSNTDIIRIIIRKEVPDRRKAVMERSSSRRQRVNSHRMTGMENFRQVGMESFRPEAERRSRPDLLQLCFPWRAEKSTNC